MLTVGSAFAGIGGFDEGFRRAGMRTLWQVELDARRRATLNRHFPDAQQHRDIRDCTGDPRRWADHGGTLLEYVDVMAGGFPCPVVSQAARGRNVAAWLWPEYARLIREIRPRYVVVENVEGLLYAGRGFGDILRDLAECGFDATWRVLRASDFGAPHHRARVWVVGYPNGDREPDLAVDDEASGLSELRGAVRGWPDPPRGLGVADGVPDRLDRLAALGNALVPAIAEHIGRRILESREEGRVAA